MNKENQLPKTFAIRFDYGKQTDPHLDIQEFLLKHYSWPNGNRATDSSAYNGLCVENNRSILYNPIFKTYETVYSESEFRERFMNNQTEKEAEIKKEMEKETMKIVSSKLSLIEDGSEVVSVAIDDCGCIEISETDIQFEHIDKLIEMVQTLKESYLKRMGN